MQVLTLRLTYVAHDLLVDLGALLCKVSQDVPLLRPRIVEIELHSCRTR